MYIVFNGIDAMVTKSITKAAFCLFNCVTKQSRSLPNAECRMPNRSHSIQDRGDTIVSPFQQTSPVVTVDDVTGNFLAITVDAVTT